MQKKGKWALGAEGHDWETMHACEMRARLLGSFPPAARDELKCVHPSVSVHSYSYFVFYNERDKLTFPTIVSRAGSARRAAALCPVVLLAPFCLALLNAYGALLL